MTNPAKPYHIEMGETADTFYFFAADPTKPVAELIYIGGDENFAPAAKSMSKQFAASPVMLAAIQRAEFLMRRVSEGAHRAMERLADAVGQCRDAIQMAGEVAA